MRITLWAVWAIVGGLAAGAAAAMAADAGKAEAPPAAAGLSNLESSEWGFDVFTGEKNVGRMQLKITALSGVVIIDEDFQASSQDNKEIAFQSQIVYRDGVPQKAKASTRLAGLKVMEGSVVFTSTGTEPGAKVTASGFVDKDGKLLEKPLTETRTLPVPAGTVLTHGTLLYFAPKLLPEPGQNDKIAFEYLPADIAYPGLLSFRTGCVLIRAPSTPDGNSVFTVKQVFPGGNEEKLCTLTLDKTGRVVELRLPKYTLRPHKNEPAKPADTKASPAPSTTKSGKK
jgi:hypothetical protein